MKRKPKVVKYQDHEDLFENHVAQIARNRTLRTAMENALVQLAACDPDLVNKPIETLSNALNYTK